MPKKTPSKTPVKVQDSAAVEEEKPSSVQKKRCDEIDEIFAGKKKKKENKQEKVEVDVKTSDTIENSRKLKKRKKSDRAKEDAFANTPSRSRKKSKDGFALYTEEELGINKADAGGTSLCPFDCSCCF